VRHDKNYHKNVHWLKMLKEHELSAVALQPSMDKNGIQDEYNIYRKGEKNMDKSKVKKC